MTAAGAGYTSVSLTTPCTLLDLHNFLDDLAARLAAGGNNDHVTSTVNSLTVTRTPDAAAVVTSLTPATGPAAGGTSVVIAGSNLFGATKVKFGATEVTIPSNTSDTSITVNSPAGVANPAGVDVVVVGTGGSSAAGRKFVYT